MSSRTARKPATSAEIAAAKASIARGERNTARPVPAWSANRR